ncbi:MAG: hypothetical protein PVH23_01805 [candidate division WOR-3 bacterium]|jgi:hypothetical protein
MILLIEPNRKIRKRICDLLSRERIIAVGTYAETIEMIAKFQRRLNIIITNIRILDDILKKKTLFRLCQKLAIDVPPILSLFRKGDDKIKERIENEYAEYKFVEYDGDDTSFPDRYIAAVKELYPEVIAQIDKANELWLRGDAPETVIDAREWLIKEGFLDVLEETKYGKIAKEMEEVLPIIKKMVSTADSHESPVINKDQSNSEYKKQYLDLKRKFDLLVKYIRELDASAKKR